MRLPRVLWHVASTLAQLRTRFHLLRLRRSVSKKAPGSVVDCLDYKVLINHGLNFYVLYKDIFIKRIYHFETVNPAPFILDCGSNIGISILYFKHLYPAARILGFEPDPAIYPYTENNVLQNNLSDVRLVHAALAGEESTLTLYSDGRFGSCLFAHVPSEIPAGWVRYEVPSVRLRDYLTEPVDFLKINIEGAEWEVLADSAEELRHVREMVIEYHHLPGLPRTLHKILELLDRQGFEYLINDFDSETNSGVRPPFRLESDCRYFLLIYAKRIN